MQTRTGTAVFVSDDNMRLASGLGILGVGQVAIMTPCRYIYILSPLSFKLCCKFIRNEQGSLLRIMFY